MVETRPEDVDRKALDVIGLARGLLGPDGRVEKMWVAGGVSDQPGDLWQVVEEVSLAVREYVAKIRRR